MVRRVRPPIEPGKVRHDRRSKVPILQSSRTLSAVLIKAWLRHPLKAVANETPWA
jgi:hypothetical protein